MLEKIKGIIHKQLGGKINVDITEASRFDSIDLDSIDVVEIIFAIEDEFEVQFDDDKAQRFETIGDIIGYLREEGVTA